MKRIQVGLVLFFIAVGAGWSAPERPKMDLKEFRAGVEAAIADLEKGKIRYELLGQPTFVDADLKRISSEKHGIEVVLLGCRAPERYDFHLGYKATVVSFLERRHGVDPVDGLQRDLLVKRRAQAEKGS